MKLRLFMCRRCSVGWAAVSSPWLPPGTEIWCCFSVLKKGVCAPFHPVSAVLPLETHACYFLGAMGASSCHTHAHANPSCLGSMCRVISHPQEWCEPPTISVLGPSPCVMGSHSKTFCKGNRKHEFASEFWCLK